MSNEKKECMQIIASHNNYCDCSCCKDARLLLLDMVNELENRCKIDIALKVLKGRKIEAPQLRTAT